MRKAPVLFLISLLFVLSFIACPNKAETVWSDNFDDGNYDGWTVTNGTFVVEDGILKTGPGSLNVIRCNGYGPSTGTWSFDLLATGWTVVYFVVNSQQDLVIVFTGQYYYVQRIDVVNGSYSSVRFAGVASAWQHLNVTRNQEGRICVYNNGTLVADYVDSAYVPPPDFFIFYSTGGEAAIDNIVVSDTVDIIPSEVPFYQQPWFIPSIAAVVVVILVIVIVVLLIRRKR
jgi:hypothetical protein